MKTFTVVYLFIRVYKHFSSQNVTFISFSCDYSIRPVLKVSNKSLLITSTQMRQNALEVNNSTMKYFYFY